MKFLKKRITNLFKTIEDLSIKTELKQILDLKTKVFEFIYYIVLYLDVFKVITNEFDKENFLNLLE